MTSTTTRLAAAAASIATVAAVGAATTTPAEAATTRCSTSWGSMTKSAGTSVADGSAYATARVGHHACYDRVVFEVDGPAGRAQVGYQAATATGPSTALVVRADSGLGPRAISVLPAALPTLRKVTYLGRYDGAATVVVATRARLPFRVLTLAGPGGHSRVVVDVAHTW